MSYNTIPLRPEDLNRRERLYQKYKTGVIKPDEIVDLKQILENERYLAITEGNIPIIMSITAILTDINDYIEEKGISDLANIKVSK